jgi:CheY-like chemotaxis protein
MRVLVVDDDQDTLDLISTMLELWGHEVRALSESPLALPGALEFLPEIVFLDVSMPKIDGYEVAMLIRQHQALDSTFLVAVTGHGREQDKQRANAAGFDMHLLKPVDLNDLQVLLKERPQPLPRPPAPC